MKNVYLFQPQYTVEIRKEKNYWLPYSIGSLWTYVSQFDDIAANYTLKELVFKREPHQDIINRMSDPAIAGFSCYAWNYQYCLDLAQAIKEKWPNCKVIFGGAQCHSSLLSNKFIDSMVFAEGEKAFLQILRQNNNNQTVDIIYPKSRLTDLDIPSPYLSGVFDQIIADHPDAIWAATLETNRGCPYACTFCDWGGITYSKIKQFKLERISEELNWMARNHVAYIMTADANFGIFKERDLEIAKLIRAAADQPGSIIESMNVNFAKNSSQGVFEIATVLGSLLRGGITFSLQSMNPDTLTAIKRTNMEVNKLGELIRLSEKYNILSYSEMILGLPNETAESWRSGMTELLEIGQHQNIDVWFTQLLLNSELSQEESRRKYKIGTIMAKDYITLVNTGERDGHTEFAELITSTATMTTDEMIDCYMYSWMILHCHVTGYSQIIARYCRNIQNIGYRRFYDVMFELLKSDLVLGPHYDAAKQTVATYLKTGELINSSNFKGHTLYGMSYKFMYDNKNSIMELAAQAASQLAMLPNNILDLQKNFVYDENHNFPREFDSEINLTNWTVAATKYRIENKSANNKFDFYFSRRKNLLKNNFVQLN
jgi:putative methyltransferase